VSFFDFLGVAFFFDFLGVAFS